jgi:hypothetical protein
MNFKLISLSTLSNRVEDEMKRRRGWQVKRGEEETVSKKEKIYFTK